MTNAVDEDLVYQVTRFLIGRKYSVCQLMLQDYADGLSTNAGICLRQTTCSEDEYRMILSYVNPLESDDYLTEFNEWLIDNEIKETLLSFLEFLAYKKHHRLKTFLKLAHETNPKPVYWRYFATCAAITAAAASYFTAHQDQLDQTLDWLFYKAPILTMWLMDYVFLPINVPRVLLVVKFFTFAYTLKLILNNHVTDDAHKIKQIFKHFIENTLIMYAQFLCYLQGGILSPFISMLFIVASLSSTLFSFEECYNLKKPEPHKVNLDKCLTLAGLTSAEIEEIKRTNNTMPDIDFSEYERICDETSPETQAKLNRAKPTIKWGLDIQFLETQYYYDRKQHQLLIEFMSLVLITSGSIIVILGLLPLPYLNIFFIVFQFFVNQAKSAYFFHIEQEQAKTMQTDVSKSCDPFVKSTASSNDSSLFALR